MKEEINAIITNTRKEITAQLKWLNDTTIKRKCYVAAFHSSHSGVDEERKGNKVRQTKKK